ncbi:hypothetical protein MBLNU230_g6830t1 [Neophaeotheca triangularis]
MPKKRTPNFKPYSTTSATSNTNTPNNAPTGSVNEKLSALRLEETPEALAKKRALAEAANQKSVHPSVRGLLGQAETAPPKPKAGVRARERLRTPGPAPPKSWTKGSASGAGGMAGLAVPRRKRLAGQKKQAEIDRRRPREPQRLANMMGFPWAEEKSGVVPKLSHLTLKALARNWDLLDEEDYPALVDLPLHLRLKLISFLGVYGPTIDVGVLKALLQDVKVLGSLDLGGLAGHGELTIRRLTQFIRGRKEFFTASSDGLAIEHSAPESWELEDATHGQPHLASVLPSCRVSALAYLSLSHPPPTVSWGDLLALSKHTTQLRYLSLAYWPRPTLTPNLATTTVTNSRGPDVTAGGSHFYSDLDSDTAEPFVLLRRLSANTNFLEWLDLEGCRWIVALAVGEKGVPGEQAEKGAETQNDDWSSSGSGVRHTCHDNWRALSYINCSQGWVPDRYAVSEVASVVAGTWEESDMNEGLVAWAGSVEGFEYSDWSLNEARVWRDRELVLLRLGRAIHALRRSKRCSATTLDYGWRQITS